MNVWFVFGIRYSLVTRGSDSKKDWRVRRIEGINGDFQFFLKEITFCAYLNSAAFPSWSSSSSSFFLPFSPFLPTFSVFLLFLFLPLFLLFLLVFLSSFFFLFSFFPFWINCQNHHEILWSDAMRYNMMIQQIVTNFHFNSLMCYLGWRREKRKRILNVWQNGRGRKSNIFSLL